MKKQLIPLLLTMVMLFGALSTTAFAAGDPKVGPPATVTLFMDGDDENYEGVPAGQTQAIRLKLSHDPKFMEIQGSVKEGDPYAYAYNIHYQTRVDGGTWLDTYHFGGADNFNQFVDGPTYEEWVFSAYGDPTSLEGDERYPYMKDMLLTFERDGETWYYIDIQNHLVEARARYELVDDIDGGYSEQAQYFSEWSQIAQIGKGAAQGEAPKEFPTAPVLSEMQLKENVPGSPPFVTFEAVHPEDVKNAAANPLGMTLYYVEARYDEGLWQELDFSEVAGLMASGTEWYPLPTRTDDEAIVIDATKMELRMRYEWYLAANWLPSHEACVTQMSFASPWSEVIAVNAEGWTQKTAASTAKPEENKSAANASAEVKKQCGLCRICPVQPLGICLFVWIFGGVLLLIVLIIVLVRCRKK